MATRSIVPRADGEGAIGTSAKKWGAVNTGTLNTTTINGRSTSDDAKKLDLSIQSFSSDGAILTATRADGTTATYNVVGDNAAAHNAIYRGKDLTAAFDDGTMSTNIANGTFHDIFIGDYITKNLTVGSNTFTVKWLVADCDYEYLAGSEATASTHHVLMIPQDVLGVNIRMNATDDTTGAYTGSEMWKTTLPTYTAAIQAAFGSSHVLAHQELLTNAVSASAASGAGAGWVGSSSDWSWQSVTANLMNENMVYGGRVFSSSGFDTGERNSQLAIFRLDPSARIAGYRGNRTDRRWWWLSSVVSSSRFALCDILGDANYNHASYSDSGSGLRPYFLLT